MPSRKFRKPGPILYGRYACSHGEWLELDGGTVPGDAYADGFLPYARLADGGRHLFYMGRSLRIDMARYAMEKKRRYSHRQWQKSGLVREHLDKATFLERYGDRAASLAGGWMKSRFGTPYLDTAEFRHVMEKPFLEDVLTWSQSGSLAAFALIVRGSWGAHYWFAFYRQDEAGTHPPGHGYMGDFLDWVRELGLPYAYLGTSYGLKSRYKSRGLLGLEFWDGRSWINDRELLGQNLHEDDTPSRQPEAAGSGAPEIAHDSLV